ncbi:DUF6191 domain-containing protein [Kitasatospora sp. NBC_00458]|uniref:DUF6191 domain-containing protein n=1 Tax=Kitasatospora sp. NBC_00458 TaxID=2903568 RepID=UPI002E17A699
MVLLALLIGLVVLVSVRRSLWRGGRGGRGGRAGRAGRAAGPGRSGSGVGLGMTAFEELHALFSAGKRVQVEQRQARLVLRDDDHSGARPRTGVDLETGTAVIRREREREREVEVEVERGAER